MFWQQSVYFLVITAHIGSSIKFVDIYGPWKITEKIRESAISKICQEVVFSIVCFSLIDWRSVYILDEDSMMDGNVE